MGRPRRVSPRDRILDAALTTFAAHGTVGTSVQAVADAAGMSKQAVLHHFPTKERLRDGVYELLADRFREQLPGVATELVSRSHDRYRALIELVLERFDENEAPFRFLAFELLERPDAVLAWLKAEAAPWLGLIKGVVEQSKDFKDGFDPEAHVAVLGAMMLTQSALVPRSDARWRRRMKQAVLRAMYLSSHLDPVAARRRG
ncbi:MAG: TetR/AcrR family transcriptional regulator [Myxococcaceae bacterium]|jgi:AcrR family transcriptional regulator|nr:TetR/AcrR family transcriptional regulator [Myxococcaceae bacterium]